MNVQPRQFNRLAFFWEFRLPEHLEFIECTFRCSCRSFTGSINGDNSKFNQIVACSDVTLQDCSAVSVISEKMGITWYNKVNTFAQQILANTDIVLDGVSAFRCQSILGSITASKGRFNHLITSKNIDLEKILVNVISSGEADLARCSVQHLEASDKVALIASKVQVLTLKITQKKGVIVLNERSHIQQVVIVPGAEIPEISLSGNGYVGVFINPADFTIVNFIKK